MHHRGPDGSGVEDLGAAVLGHRRLSIIDIGGGAQPMANEDGTVWTVFNGEIWNHEALRADLERQGHRFASRCDTEVLVHGYEEWGVDLAEHLDGMFAFAVWDMRQERLLLATDRMGKKPLYLSNGGGLLVFGSDARAVLVAAGANPRVNVERVPAYLFQRYVNAPDTLFEGVERFPPATSLVFDRDRIRRWRHWSLPAPSPSTADAGVLREQLQNAVTKRLMSDVPLGAFLSGGVDSAAIVALAASQGRTLATFTAGFTDPVFDERRVAAETARRFNTDHHEVVVSPDDFVRAFPRLVWYRDEPVAEPAELALLLLSEFARSKVKVVLSGEGGDELFGGYPKYRAERLLRLPGHVGRLPLRVRAWVDHLRSSHRQLDRARQTLTIEDELLRWASWFRTFAPDELADLLAPPLRELAAPEELTKPLRRRLEPYADVDPGRRMLLGDLMTYLPDNMLLRGDKVTMAASLEARMPLLDRAVVESAAAAPISQRAAWRTPKRMLRAAVADLLPAAVTRGPKRGFPVPITQVILNAPGGYVDELLLSDRTHSRGLLNRDAVEAVLRRARAGEQAAELQVFSLISLEQWCRTNVDELTLEPPSLSDPVPA
jgi:asparagine synthase (glutamine-hydrolysing)